MDDVSSHRVILLVYLTFVNSVVGSEREQTNTHDTTLRDPVAIEVGMTSTEKEVFHTPDDNATFLEDIPPRPDEMEKSSHHRHKRVLFGTTFKHVVNSDLSYPVLYYFVVVSNAHQCTLLKNDDLYQQYLNRYPDYFKLAEKVESACVETYHNPRCGGTMVAPRIVLTACHCLATFGDFDLGTKIISKEKDVWEDHNLIFRPGLTDKFVTGEGIGGKNVSLSITTDTQFLFSRKYYVHEKCQHIRKKVFSYDFGFIFLSEHFLGVPDYVEKHRGQQVKVPPPTWFDGPRYYAPLMTQQALEDSWARVQRHQTTCLHMGVGYDSWLRGSYYSLPALMQIKFTWRSIVSYSWCANHIKKAYSLAFNDPVWRTVFDCEKGYKDCATWDCSLKSGRITGVPALGDEGGPVICGGLPYAIITGAFSESSVTFISPLAFNYEVTADLRTSLLQLEGGVRDVLGDLPGPRGVPTGQSPQHYSTACRGIAGLNSLIFALLQLFLGAL